MTGPSTPPQDAAVVTSALLAQQAATAESLRLLNRALEAAVGRGDIELREVAAAREDLEIAAADVEQNLDGLGRATLALHHARSGFVRSPDLHGNLVAVAALLGEGVTVAGEHTGGDCTCTVVVPRGDERYFLYFGDSGWTLLRDSAGVPRPDGSKSWTDGGSIDILAKDELVHPHQLAQEVLEALQD